MRKPAILHILSAVLSIVACSAICAAPGALPRIAVAPFSGTNSQFSMVISEEVSTQLVKSGRWDVIEYQQVAKLLEKMGFDMSGPVDTETAVQIGKIKGCQAIATGTLMDASAKRASGKGLFGKYDNVVATIKINFKVLDAETGQIFSQNSITKTASASAGSADTDSLLRQAACYAAEEAVRGIVTPIKGKVVLIKADNLVINLGSLHGVGEADEWLIQRPGEAITDPETGKVLGRDWVEITRAHVVKGSIQPQMCSIVPGEWRSQLLGYTWKSRPDKIPTVQKLDEVIRVVPQH